MWSQLPETQREEYKKMILAFCRLTKLFAQKSVNDEDDENVHTAILPILNSKYQETIFQKVFHATAEDINNSPFDVSLKIIKENGQEQKYVVGIKTFGYKTDAQKIAQFKSSRDDWSADMERIRSNVGHRSLTEINEINAELYRNLAINIATIRNRRINSHIANLNGFSVLNNEEVNKVYHVLMPMLDGTTPYIVVGETNYDTIDVDNIVIEGCKKRSNPTNIYFHDNNHKYRFTSADCQLYMYFDNSNIEKERWQVQYVRDAYRTFSRFAELTEEQSEESIIEFHSWKIRVEQFSGFNMFNSLSSKNGPEIRAQKIESLIQKYADAVSHTALANLRDNLNNLNNKSLDKQIRCQSRNDAINLVRSLGNDNLLSDILKIVYHEKGEIYIPIPNARQFHSEHPDFFIQGAGNLIQKEDGAWVLPFNKEHNTFPLVFEPSGEEIDCYITQEAGKAIQSVKHQDILGEWIREHVFQLEEYEPLTQERLEELEINGIRLDKMNDGKIHLRFIYNNNPDIKPGEFID